MNTKYEISEKWIKASVIGTSWAASEIVLGSFLHNLRIPFSSNVLTAIGVIILISSSYKWTGKGLFWRAGLICALMKTMSPSAIIFGPMIAIFSQAALLEISVRVFRKNIFGFVIGSMLAMSWNLFQKIMNFIIFYGFNIVDVYADLLRYAQKQLHIQSDIVWLPVFILLAIYCVLGFITALIGIKVGRKLLTQSSENESSGYSIYGAGTNNNIQSFNHSIVWLLVDFVLIIVALVLLNFTSWMVWSVSIAAIVSIWVIRYKRALRQLSKPRFWVCFVVITMITAFVFNKMQSQDFVNGLIIGIQMNFRAVVIILGFSVLGTELYNPKIRNFFLKTSFKQLPLALELSFKSLPMMIANIPELKVIVKNPVSVIYQIISQIEFRLAEIKKNLPVKIVIISGSVGQGKTTLLQKLAEVLKAKNISVGGILSPRVMEPKTTIGYDVVDIVAGKREPFLRKNSPLNFDKIGSYYILSDGLQAGTDVLTRSKNSKNQIVIIDEVGKLELAGKGWAKNIEEFVNGSNSKLVLSVRNSFTEQIIEKWNLQNYTIFDISQCDYRQVSDWVIQNIG